MSGRSRKTLQRAAALALGLSVVAAASELAYRALRTSGLSPTTNPAYVRHDPALGWSYVPGTRERHRGGEFDVAVRINAQGFRGDDWPALPGDRRPRILVLGDSYAFGWGVEQEETFTAVLAQLAPGWCVLNAAVSGYGTDQELLLLEKLLPEVDPALVVSVFCENDLFENASPVVYGKHKPCFVRRGDALELAGVPVPEPWLERHSYLYRALAKELWQASVRGARLDREGEWALTLDLFREEVRRLHGVPLLIVSDRRRLAAFARDEDGVEHLDLREVFAPSEEPVVFARDGHWTPPAHALLARALHAAAGRLLPAE